MKAESLRLNGLLLGCVVWAIIGLSVVAYGGTRVELDRLGDIELLPGDLVEVRVTAIASEYSRFTLREPGHSALRFVATQAFPVLLNEDSEYESKWVVVYQTLQSGSVSLEKGFLESSSGDELERIALQPLAFEVQGFGDEMDHDDVERFGGASLLDKVVSKRWMFTLLAGMIILFYFVMRAKRKKESLQSEVDQDPFQAEVSALILELNSEVTPRDRLAGFLERFRSRCSPLLAREIELLVYSKNGNARRLVELIGKECSK